MVRTCGASMEAGKAKRPPNQNSMRGGLWKTAARKVALVAASDPSWFSMQMRWGVPGSTEFSVSRKRTNMEP